MFNLIEKFYPLLIVIGFIVLIFGLVAYNHILKADNARKDIIISTQKQYMEEQNNAIDRLRKLGDERQRKINELEKLNAKRKKESELRVKKILAEQVPIDCNGAVDWAIHKAKSIN